MRYFWGTLIGTICMVCASWYFFREDAVILQSPERVVLSESNEIELINSQQKILLKKNKDWTLIEPFVWPVNSCAVNAFFQQLKDFSKNLPANASIRVAQGDRSKYFTSDDLPDESWDKFFDAGFWLKSVTCPLKFNKISYINFSSGEKLKKEHQQWRFLEPVKMPAKNKKVEVFLKNLLAGEWMTGKNSFGDVPDVSITLIDEIDHDFTINFSKPNDSEKRFRYAWLDTPTITCQYLDDEVFQNPLKTFVSLSEILSGIENIFIEFKRQNLFILCDENAHWSAFNFSPDINFIANFDIQKLLVIFDLIRPIRFIPKEKFFADEENSVEKLQFTVNEATYFNLLKDGENEYLLLVDRNIMFEIVPGIFQKIKAVSGFDHE